MGASSSKIELPDAELSWQDWFRTLLHSVQPLAAEYPGVAKWMLMHDPTIPAVLEAGMAILRRAGFGDRTELAYAVLLNSAMLTISMVTIACSTRGTALVTTRR